MFSLNEWEEGQDKPGQPIAIVRLKPSNEKANILYLHEKAPEAPTDKEMMEAIRQVEDENPQLRLSHTDEKDLILNLKEDKKPRKEQMAIAFRLVKETLNNCIGKEILFKDDKELIPVFVPREDEKQNTRLMVSACPGAGKSYWINKVLHSAIAVYKTVSKGKPELFVFSCQMEDPSLDEGLKLTRFTCDESLLIDEENGTLRDPFNVKDFRGKNELAQNWIIFDDTESILNKDVNKRVEKLRNECLQQARHENLNVVTVSHELMNGGKTKPLISNSSHICIFPKAGNTSQIARFLKTYISLPPDEIEKITKKLDSRWVLICKKAPMYVLYSNGAYIIQ